MLSNILGIAGLVVGIAGIAYARYENRERAKAERFVRAAGWDLYNKASNQNGHVQIVSDLLIKAPEKNIEAINQISKADAFGQYLLRDAAKLIHHVEPKFDEELIIRWVESERVFSGHKEIFMALTPSIDTKYKHRSKDDDRSSGRGDNQADRPL
ncbi:hypothetical protein [Salinisphaera sp. T5B8]|uniref:hypothetical protein n=1 Tax=Salinisphaera sp. T5B8 TaxID=1304154 RepID=UPI00333EDDA1